MDALAYSEKQIDVLMSVVTLLLPLSTGFVVLAAAGLPKLAAAGALKTGPQRRNIIASFVLIVFSIGLWGGCLAFMLDSARPFKLSPATTPMLKVPLLNAEWGFAIRCAQIGFVSFFFALVFYAAAAYPALGVVIREKGK
jgi:hypothetical protein